MKDDRQILEELRKATEDLWMMSESDYPFELVHWEQPVEITPEFLRQVAKQPEDAEVEEVSLDWFFRGNTEDHQGDSQHSRQTKARFRKLQKLLETILKDVTVYRIGEVEIPAYIVGQAPSGNWLGLSTKVVET